MTACAAWCLRSWKRGPSPSLQLTGYEALPKKELLLRTAARGMPAKGNRGDLAKRLLAWDLGVVVGGPSSAGTAVVEDVPGAACSATACWGRLQRVVVPCQQTSPLSVAALAVRVAGVDALVTLYDVPVQESVVGNTRRLRPDGGALVDVVRRISALSRASAAPADEGAGATGAPRPQLIAFVEEPQIIPRMTGAISGFWSGMYHGMYAGMFMMVDAVVVPVKPSSWKGDLRWVAWLRPLPDAGGVPRPVLPVHGRSCCVLAGCFGEAKMHPSGWQGCWRPSCDTLFTAVRSLGKPGGAAVGSRRRSHCAASRCLVPCRCSPRSRGGCAHRALGSEGH